MRTQPNAARRSHGTGSLIEKNGIYYGKWRVAGRQVMRKVGPVRKLASHDGLTKSQAEAQLRKLMADVTGGSSHGADHRRGGRRTAPEPS
jgi:hypothetical protein